MSNHYTSSGDRLYRDRRQVARANNPDRAAQLAADLNASAVLAAAMRMVLELSASGPHREVFRDIAIEALRDIGDR